MPATLRAWLIEQAAADSAAVERLFGPECLVATVYRGHVDDFRNTDDAWLETTATHFHARESIAQDLQLDVRHEKELTFKGERVVWYDADEVTVMYASHIEWLGMAVRGWRDHPDAER